MVDADIEPLDVDAGAAADELSVRMLIDMADVEEHLARNARIVEPAGGRLGLGGERRLDLARHRGLSCGDLGLRGLRLAGRGRSLLLGRCGGLLRLGSRSLRLVLRRFLGVEAGGQRRDLRAQRLHLRFQRRRVRRAGLERRRQSEKRNAGQQGKAELGHRHGSTPLFIWMPSDGEGCAESQARSVAQEQRRAARIADRLRAPTDPVVRGNAMQSGAQGSIVPIMGRA